MIKTRIQTYSVIAGSTACNAKCPYCVSRMTPKVGLDYKISEPNWRNFEKGCEYAKDSGVSTVLITGKGEPTLFPDQISDYLTHLENYKFPFIEMQTNGITLAKQQEKMKPYLKDWYDKGLTTFAISMVHYDSKKNKEIYEPTAKEHYELEDLIKNLHDEGFSVRLTNVMVKDYIDNLEGVLDLINFAKENKVEQLTVRSVESPNEAEDASVKEWADERKIEQEKVDEIRDFLDENGTRLLELVHGAIVYDYEGQNICVSNCLTMDPNEERIRQLIFFPDGHLRYDWAHEGAIIL